MLECMSSDIYNNIKEVHCEKEGKTLSISVGKEQSIDISVYNEEQTNDFLGRATVFNLSKEDGLFSCFETLINDIVRCNVFKVSISELELCTSDKEIIEKLEQDRKRNQVLKDEMANARLMKNGGIVIASDDSANIMIMKKICNKIRLEFVNNSEEVTDEIRISISNGISKNGPFSICFKRLDEDIQEMVKLPNYKKLLINN